MTENLIEQEKSDSQKPDGLPDKFWDEEKGEVKLLELIEDYNSLACKDDNLIEINNRTLPASFDKYDIKVPHPLLEKDDEVLKKLFDNGFSNQQAQLVYDLANERIIPYLDNMAVDFEAQKQLEKLERYFGSKEKFDQVSKQLSAWAKQNMSKEVYEALATTADGVVTIYKMMSSNEPTLNREIGKQEELSEDSLKQMMQDPRYWRDRDKAYIAKIRTGFEKLYPNK